MICCPNVSRYLKVKKIEISSRTSGLPRHQPLTTEPSLPEVGPNINLTVGVIAYPPPDTFRFVRRQSNSDSSSVPHDWFHVDCTQTALLSRYACVISVGDVTMKDGGEYGVEIGNELGRFRYFFRLLFIVGK